MDSTQPADVAPKRGSESAQKRDEAAGLRDESAALRDEVARLRDEVADLRDTEPGLDDQTAGPGGGAEPRAGRDRVDDQASEPGGEVVSPNRPPDDDDEAADRHDDDAAERDKEAHDRDAAAEERDEAARAVERSQDAVTVEDARSRADAATARKDAASDRRGSEQDRRRAADERTAAGVDRDASAGDRRHSEQDRDGSATDRVDAMEEIDAASLDALTATYARGPGMVELERDRSRADRAGDPMTLAFIDVDDLKGTNDRAGHPAGDRLLRQVADTIRAHTRPHDVIVRYGGDEFVGALIGMTRAAAAERLAAVDAALAEGSERASITVGLAELEPGESLSSLIRRADESLYRQRGQR